MSLGSLLHAAAALHPDKSALICGDEALTYRELDRKVSALASWLLQQGLRPGDRVAIHDCNSIPAALLYFACFRAGLIAVALNMRLKAPEIAYILGHSKPALFFSAPQFARIAAEAGAGRPILSALPELDAANAAWELPQVEPDSPALILYTSGTTARPKGVTHTHGSLAATADLMRQAGMDSTQIVLMMTSMMHASGIMCQLIPGMVCGATVVMLPAFDAAAALDAIQHWKCTYLVGMPSMMQFLLAELSLRRRDTGSVRLAYAGGDTVPVALQARFEEWFGVPLQEIFGLTECVPACGNLRTRNMRQGSIGKVFDSVHARVLDGNGGEAAAGERGEFAVRSPGNFVGYWDNPGETEQSLVDGWLITGDLVRRDAEGYYWFEGRKKQLIVRGGSNISPQEVEEALYQHPSVFEAGVIGLPDPVCGESVVAYVALQPGAPVETEELREFLGKRISDHKVPETIVFLDALPKGLTGKVDRRALKEMAVGKGSAAAG